MDQEVIEVDLENIRVNPNQPRKYFEQEELEELAQSIRSVGLIQPPVVRSLTGSPGKFELIAGERRFRAAELVGMKKLSVILSYQTLDYSAEAALIENIQRVDLNPLDISRALRRLIVEFGLQQDELANRVGKKRSTVTNYLRLLSLPHKVQESLQEGLISMGHAKAILSVEGFERQLALHEEVIKDGLSVRETEEAAQKVVKVPRRRLSDLKTRDCFLVDLEERLQQKFGTKVAISSKGKRGKITIDYYSLDDLERVLEVIG